MNPSIRAFEAQMEGDWTLEIPCARCAGDFPLALELEGAPRLCPVCADQILFDDAPSKVERRIRRVTHRLEEERARLLARGEKQAARIITRMIGGLFVSAPLPWHEEPPLPAFLRKQAV
jgi:hypothetical protein